MAATTLFTSEQFLAMPEELDEYGNVVHQELINGEVVTIPHAAQRHDIIRSNILEALFAYLGENRAIGLKAFPDTEFIVSPNNAFIPDVSLVAIGRLSPSEHKFIPGAPELALEVVSPSESATRRRSKIDTYLANGSRSVWIGYPEPRLVTVHTANSVRELKANQSIEDPLLPGFSTPVAAFFELS